MSSVDAIQSTGVEKTETNIASGQTESRPLVDMSNPKDVAGIFKNSDSQNKSVLSSDGAMIFSDPYGQSSANNNFAGGKGEATAGKSDAVGNANEAQIVNVLKQEVQLMEQEIKLLSSELTQLMGGGMGTPGGGDNSAATKPVDSTTPAATKPVDSNAPVTSTPTDGPAPAAKAPTDTSTPVSSSDGAKGTGAEYTVYSNGKMNWAGDWSYDGTVNYHDTTGNAPGGGQDIAFKQTAKYGGFQPYSQVPGNFDNTPYTDVTFQMKQPSAGSQYKIYAENTGDKAAGKGLDLSNYAVGKPAANGWTTYDVPLTALGVAGQKNEYKIGIQDIADGAGSTTYFDNIKFINEAAPGSNHASPTSVDSTPKAPTPVDSTPKTPTPVDSAPVATAPTGSTTSGATTPGEYMMYSNGKMNWGGDFSFAATPDYHDTTGNAPGGGQDIKVTLTGQWGGYQPYSSVPGNFDNTSYKDIQFQLKSDSNAAFSMDAKNSYDQNAGPGVDLAKYAQTTPEAGKWTTYDVPIADLGVANEKDMYKFAIQDESDPAGSSFYLDNIGFTK